LSRSGVNFWVDFSILVMLCTLLWLTSVVHFVFPAASEASGWRLWGWGFEEWLFCQLLAVCIFSLGVLLHLILHWGWVCGFLTTRFSSWTGTRVSWNEATKTAYGVSALILVFFLLGGLLLLAELQIRAPERAGSVSVTPRAVVGVPK